MNANILIYGATGYTGKLFADYLLKKGIVPVLAGRSEKVKLIAEDRKCEARIFSTDRAADHLKDIDILINLAGPFSQTQSDLIQACLSSGTHYMDIAGEVNELKTAFAFDERAKDKGIVVVPASGFGVVPTDMAAHEACQGIEDIHELTIAYATKGEASRGTLFTVLKDINSPGVEWKNGSHIEALPAKSSMNFQVGGNQMKGVYNPWRADLFTAVKSTGAKNVQTFTEFPGFVVSMMKGKLGWLRMLLLNHLLKFLPEGPNEKQLQKGKTYIWAEAKSSDGRVQSVEVTGPEAYVFTAESLYQVAQKIGNIKNGGVFTPSQLGLTFSDFENIEIVRNK